MTSGISFRKLLGRNLKKQTWLIVLMSVACAIILPIRLFMELDMQDRMFYNAAEALAEEKGIERGITLAMTASRSLKPTWFMLFCVIFAAALAGITGFAYLHSKVKVDYYHSFAVRREKYFFVPYLGGVIACVVPYLVSVAASLFIVLPAKGIFSGSLVALALLSALDLIVYFLAVYTVVCLGMMLTGRVLIGTLLSALMLGFGPVIYMLYTTLMGQSFVTYYATSGPHFGLYLSPLTMGFLNDQDIFSTGILILLAVIAAAVLVLTVVLYKKRPSEAAEQPFAYRPMQSVIKVLATIPGALIFGMLFRYMFGLGEGRMAFVIWTLVGAFLINGLIEFIYSTDLKNVGRHWRSGLIIAAAVAAVLLFFEADILGFDKKIPAKEAVESMSVSHAQTLSYLGDSMSDTYDTEITTAWLDNTAVSDFDALYELAEEGLRYTNGDPAAASAAGETLTVVNFAVKFNKKSGGSVYRQFQIPIEVMNEKLFAESEREEFREKSYVLDRFDLKNYNGIVVSAWGFGVPVGDGDVTQLTDAELNELCACLKRDAVKNSLADLKGSLPAASIFLNWRDGGSTSGFTASDYLDSIYVYPQYQETLSFLAKHGVRAETRADVAEEAAEVYVNCSEYQENGDYYENHRYVFRDADEIRDLFASIRPLRSGYADTEAEYRGSIEIFYADGYDGYVEFAVTDEARYQQLVSGKEDLNA